MLDAGEIARRLHRHLERESREFTVEDVRIGGSYIAVVLAPGRIGLAARLKDPASAQIEIPRRGLCGRIARVLLDGLVQGRDATECALGLATANALIHPTAEDGEEDTVALMGLRPGESVAMVGLFRPLLGRIAQTGAVLSVIEQDTDPRKRRQALASCDVAVITATTLINGTLEEILNELGRPRRVSLIGPSTPLCEPVFRETPVTHLGGSAVADAEGVLRVVAEGGGTPAMRPFLRFVNRHLARKS
jgi:hypothetical protein